MTREQWTPGVPAGPLPNSLPPAHPPPCHGGAGQSVSRATNALCCSTVTQQRSLEMAPCTRLSQRDCTQGPAAAARQAPAAQPRASAAPRSRLAANGGSAALGPGGAAAARGSRRLYAAAVPQPAQEAAPEPAPPATPQQGGVEGMVWNAEMQAEWEAYQARTERGAGVRAHEGRACHGGVL